MRPVYIIKYFNIRKINVITYNIIMFRSKLGLLVDWVLGCGLNLAFGV